MMDSYISQRFIYNDLGLNTKLRLFTRLTPVWTGSEIQIEHWGASKYGRIRWPSTSGLPFWSQHSLPASGGATVNCKPQGQNSFKSMPFAITRADQNVIDKRRVSNGPSWVTQGRAGRGGIGGLPWAGHVQSVLWVCCVLDETCQKCHGKCSNANADGDADDDDDDDEVTYN